MAHPTSIEEAISQIADLRRRLEWAGQRPGGGPRKVAGFTETETRVLRIIASRDFIAYEQFDALQRHMSNIRKKLPDSILIKTVVSEGYVIESGLDILRRLVAGEISLVVEAVTDALATRVKTKKPTKRAADRKAAHRSKRKQPYKPVVKIVPMVMAA